MKSAPWLAMRTLKQLAIDDGPKYPEAAQTLQDEFYVDDLIGGHNTISQAQQLQSSLINEGLPIINLLAAKARVAPLAQKITLPRIELCGALLLSQLARKAVEAFKGRTTTIQAWSDSQVVLAWLQGDICRWKKYVANSVSKIKQVIPAENWHYVKSELNPANCASRGMYATKLLNFDLWWKGPDFIQTLENQMVPMCLHTTNTGLKSTVTALPKNQETHFIDELMNKHSSLTRITRVTAWVRRYCTSVLNNLKCETIYLTTSEVTTANELVTNHIQQIEFEQKLTYEEFTTLLTKMEACMNSRPFCPLTEDPEEFYNYLTPGHFLTGSPILTLLRTDYSDIKTIDIRRRWQLTENMLQQFWKSWSNEYITQLLIDQVHSRVLHGGARLTLAYIRQRYWIVGGNRTDKTQSGIFKRPIVKLSPPPIETEIPQQQGEEKGVTSSTERAPNSRKTKGSTYKTFTTLLIALFTLVTGVHSAGDGTRPSAHITSFEPDRPVYYDALGKMQTIHDEWILLMYYNLTNYWNGIQRVENYLHSLTDVCHKTDPRYCVTTLGQLSHEMDLLQHYNSLLLTPHQHLGNRKKRGLINGIGSIANSLFGVLDQNFADKYHQDIKGIQNNQNYLLGLIKNQTSIVELENKVLKKTENNIHKQLDMVDSFMNETSFNLAKIESTMEIVMATSYFNSASLATYLLLKNLREMQELLFDTLTNVYKGHMDVHLLTPVNLVEQLNIIAGSLPKRLSLPLENVKQDIKDIYKIMYVKARVTSTYFLFEVHIPLTTDEEFLLYKVTPIPVRNQTEYAIIPLQSQYIAVNFKKSSYISPSEKEIKQCTVMRKDRLVCNENLPIYSLENKNAPCEAKLLSHKTNSACDVRKTSCSDVWVELHSSNSWLAVCCGVCTLRTVCDNDVSSYVMTSSGIVTLKQGCLLQSNDFSIYSRNEYNTNMRMEPNFNIAPLNSTVNRIVNLTYHKVSWDILHRAEETQDINDRLLYQKEREILPEPITTHDIHQYALCYILLAIVIVIIITIIWVVKKYRPHILAMNKQERSREPRNENIELQPRPNQERVVRKAPSHAASPPAKPPRKRGERQPSPTKEEDNIAFTFDE